MSRRHAFLGRRRREDRALILATDGLWDVVPAADAVLVVTTALGGGNEALKVLASCHAMP